MNVIEDPDFKLLRAYRQSGSHESIGVLARKYYGFILGVCRRELRNAEMADDAAQEVLLELMRRAHRLDAKNGLAPWLFRAAISRSRDLARSEARRQKREQRYEQPKAGDEQAINELLDKLPEAERNALLLRFVGGYSFEEIGARFGLSPDAARMRVNRGLDRLKQSMAACGLAISPEAALQFEPQEPPKLPAKTNKVFLPPYHAKWIAISGAIVGSLGTIALMGNPLVASSGREMPGREPASSVGGGLISVAAAMEADWLPFYAEVTLSQKGGTPIESKYWRDGEKIRMTEMRGEMAINLRIDKKEALSMAWAPTPASSIEGRIIKGSPNQRFVETDAWEAALLQLPVIIYSNPPVTPWLLKDALNGRKPEGEVTLKHPDGQRTYRVTFDPSKGDMASRCQYTFRSKDAEFKYDIRVTDWQKVGTHWFPKRLKRTSTFNGNPSYETTIDIRNVKIGKDAPAMPAMPKPERNAIVMDDVRHVWYRVDENWKRITPETPTTPGHAGGGG